ncbi:hypothetical protein ACFL5O_10410 [Myxococcota bacterium]
MLGPLSFSTSFTPAPTDTSNNEVSSSPNLHDELVVCDSSAVQDSEGNTVCSADGSFVL